MSATIYLDRDNKVTLELKQNGSMVAENSVTKAALWLPGNAFSDGNAKSFDTDGQYMELADNATKVRLDLGEADINKGTYRCYLTVYDAVNTNGIAWDVLIIAFTEWPV